MQNKTQVNTQIEQLLRAHYPFLSGTTSFSVIDSKKNYLLVSASAPYERMKFVLVELAGVYHAVNFDMSPQLVFNLLTSNDTVTIYKYEYLSVLISVKELLLQTASFTISGSRDKSCVLDKLTGYRIDVHAQPDLLPIHREFEPLKNNFYLLT